MVNLKKTKKHIKQLEKELKKELKHLNKVKKINFLNKVKKEVNVEGFSTPVTEKLNPPIGKMTALKKIQDEIVKKKSESREKGYLPTNSFDDNFNKDFYHVGKIIAKDVEKERLLKMTYDKCKLFDEIFNVLEKYVDEVVEAHVKLDEMGVNFNKRFDLAKSIEKNLKVKHVDGIDYNPKRNHSPQQTPLNLVNANKDHPKIDPKKSESIINEILKNKSLDDVKGLEKKKSEHMSVKIDGVEIMIPQKIYGSLDELKGVLGVLSENDLKRSIKTEDGRIEYTPVVRGKTIIADKDDSFYTSIPNPLTNPLKNE